MDIRCQAALLALLAPGFIKITALQAIMGNMQDLEQQEPDADGGSSSSSSNKAVDVNGPDKQAIPSTTAASVADSQQGLQQDYTQLNSKQRKRLASSSPMEPIWTIQPQPIFFDADRPSAKELAKALTART